MTLSIDTVGENGAILIRDEDGNRVINILLSSILTDDQKEKIIKQILTIKF